MTQTVTRDTLNAAADFDHVFTLTPNGDGTATITHPRGIYAPDVWTHPTDDVEWVAGANWEPLTGHTGQYGYSGAIMHASETLSGGLADRMIREGGTYVVVEVREEDGTYSDGDAIGWAVMRADETVNA